MRQLYYTVQILLRGRGSNFIKLVSLTPVSYTHLRAHET